ncbi:MULTISPECIES: divergent polysaccharide deacetylase family protein [Pacificibacter]|uniref:divergent polysaccharide deacetylase family protein n=1 Tax=Pacificibacter TaxID=1042323 RepID=UPI001C09E103|nr:MULTISPECIES: divergent polysaccharide deacetylase family protein [Pacificibacter]MBU2935269.1 divergent polysaccharide deacetylase family protein [Pacificibacter marinus]MDO6615423.1 divergent polysaccharide deacetylase family protein [Pacificibacter sp. 1_MG-2023]
MGRGILAGLVWGSVVGFGIVTVANQVVDKVYVSPVSLSPAPANDDSSPQNRAEENKAAEKMAEDMGSEQVADAAEAVDAITAPEIPETPKDVDGQTPDTNPNHDQDPNVVIASPMPMDPAPEDTSDTALGEMATATPDRNITQPDKVASLAPSDTSPEAVEDTAPLPSFETPEGLEAPKIEANATPAIQGDSPVLGSPQGLELIQPNSGTAPVQVDTTLPGQKPKPLGTPATARTAADEVSGDASQAAQNIADAMSAQQPVAPKAVPKIAPQGQQALGQKVGSFTDRNDAMKSTRLPSVTGSAMADAAPVIAAEDLPAIIAFSADYTKSTTAPEMSVILVDIGELDPTSPQLSNLPFPVTFAVDALAPGASERAQMYRTAGLEVLSLIGLPEGATAQDVAVTINQARDLVPVSIGFLDVPSASFQATRDIAAQVVASAASTGHGVVSFSSGLNALMQEATRAKEPAALVFRDFDGRDQNLATIKRFLDQAAFRAGIDEDIVLVGRAKEDTMKALVEWSLGNRAATVELVPVSYLLTGGGTAAK